MTKITLFIISTFFTFLSYSQTLPTKGAITYTTDNVGLLVFSENLDTVLAYKAQITIDIDNYTITTSVPDLKLHHSYDIISLTQVHNPVEIASDVLYQIECENGYVKYEVHFMPKNKIKIVERSGFSETERGISVANSMVIYTDYAFEDNIQEIMRKE